MTYSGQCQCGAIRYQLSGEPKVVALCHCSDCRRSAGAPVVAWAMFPEALVPTVQIQTAERLNWMKHVHELPELERYPA